MNVREVVLDILLEHSKQNEYINVLVGSVLEKYDYMSGKEKAFIKRVSEGTIERMIRIDYVLECFSTTPVRKMKPLIRELLRMSGYQILFMENIPDAAVCDEAVKLAKKRGFRSLQGYVNGVLRALARQKDQIVYPDRREAYHEYLSVYYSMPLWLTEHFCNAYGEENCEKILQAFLRRGAVSIRFQETIGDKERERLIAAWRQKGVTVRQSPYLPYAVEAEKTEGVRNLEGYEEGAFSVQDVSSMLVAEAAGIRDGCTVIDVCAAPGGKSLHAADKLKGTGRVIACDISARKTDKIRENRDRLRADNVTVMERDARVCDEKLVGQADVLLVDVPCSGLGVIGKKQDIKYRVSPESMREVVKLQKEIVKNVIRYLKPDGIMMYSTCTMNPAENEEMADWICREYGMETVGMAHDMPEQLRKEADRGQIQLMPGIHGTDGFFLAKLRRRQDGGSSVPDGEKDAKQDIEPDEEKGVKQDIKSLTLDELREQMEAWGERSFRARQLYEWMHRKLAEDYGRMTNIPQALADLCRQRYTFTSLKTVQVQESALDGTRKYLFELPDGCLIESVWMRYHHGNSVCVSSQVGCRMGCRFCASTLDGLERSLLPSEMLEQVYSIIRDTGERVSNVVVMGSGEPLDNYDHVVRFIRLLTDENGLNISQRNITVSTCGIVPAMRALADEKLQITLAISLHAATDEKRRQLMPIAERYPLREVIDACVFYFAQTGRRITFEYSLVKGVNDTDQDAGQLAALIAPLNCHVNLIPVNPVKERGYVQSEKHAVQAFQEKLERKGIHVTVRREMGRDIDGACGQLRRRYMDG